MFGWIENGGGVDKYFTNSFLKDIVFHTESTDNTLIIGNGKGNNLNAALYVSSNCVGVRKMPDTRYSIDIAGSMCVQDEIVFSNAVDPQGKIVMNNSGMSMSRNSIEKIYFDTFGILKSNTMICDNIKSRKETNTLIAFKLLSRSTTGFSAELDIIYADKIETDNIISINNKLYYVTNAFTIPELNKLVMEFDYYLEEQRSSDNELEIDILYRADILVDILETLSNTEYTYIPFYIREYLIENVTTISIEMRILDATNRSFLIPNSYYHIKTSNNKAALNEPVTNIAKLTTFQFWEDNVTVNLTLQSVDNLSSIQDMFESIFYNPAKPIDPSKALFLFKLDTVMPKSVSEENISWGYFIETDPATQITERRAAIKSSELVTYVNKKELAVNLLSTIVFESQYASVYEVDNSFVSNNSVILNLRDFNLDPYAILETSRGSITYAYLANPVPIKSVQLIDAVTIEYTVKNAYNFLTDLYRFVDSYAFIIDQQRDIWIVKKVIVTSSDSYIQLSKASGAPLNQAYLLQERIIYILPFKIQGITLLGDRKNNCYIVGSLGIGTNLVNDRLTVAGTATIYNQLTMYDSVLQRSARLYFSDETLTLYNKLQVKQDAILIGHDTYVDGLVQAKDYLSVSDRNLKKRIKEASPTKDLAQLLKLQVKDFQFIDDKRCSQHKGVIAQEIEKQLPCIVNKTTGYLPNIYKKGYISKSGRYLFILGDWSKILTYGKIFRYRNSDGIDVVCNVCRSMYIKKRFKTKVVLKRPLHDVSSIVKIYGTSGEYKTIDKDYLFMMAINAIKALTIEVQNLKMCPIQYIS